MRNKFTDLQTIINGNGNGHCLNSGNKIRCSFSVCLVYFKRISYPILSRYKYKSGGFPVDTGQKLNVHKTSEDVF